MKSLATFVLIVHACVVVFIVGGLLLVLIGGWFRWGWVRNFWFRALHLVAIGYVVAESWIGIDCPLTTLEQALRERAGEVSYSGDFIGHWLRAIMFYEAPPWAFTTAYSAFALLVAWSWMRIPPASPESRRPLPRT